MTRVFTRRSTEIKRPPDLTRSQLFLGDLWIGEQHKLTRPWHPADVYPEPVLCAEKLWEETSVSVATVMKTDDHWKKYYGARHATPRTDAVSSARAAWEKSGELRLPTWLNRERLP